MKRKPEGAHSDGENFGINASWVDIKDIGTLPEENVAILILMLKFQYQTVTILISLFIRCTSGRDTHMLGQNEWREKRTNRGGKDCSSVGRASALHAKSSLFNPWHLQEVLGMSLLKPRNGFSIDDFTLSGPMVFLYLRQLPVFL